MESIRRKIFNNRLDNPQTVAEILRKYGDKRTSYHPNVVQKFKNCKELKKWLIENK